MLKQGQPFKNKNTGVWYEVISSGNGSYTARNVDTGEQETVPLTEVAGMVNIEIDLADIPEDRVAILHELAAKQGCSLETALSMLLEDIANDLLDKD